MEYNVLSEYFRLTVKRFYSLEQRERILSLIARSEGLTEYKQIREAIRFIEERGIKNCIEAKNFSLISETLVSDPAIVVAAEALVESYSRQFLCYHDPLEWALSLRSADPTNDDLSMELAFYEYSNGNISAAISTLKKLVSSSSSIQAIKYLAAIYSESEEYLEAIYYISLLQKIYTDELGLTPSAYIENSVRELQRKLSCDQLKDISMKLDQTLPYVINRKKAIGFLAQ